MTAGSKTADRVPKPGLCLTVGVTGHREGHGGIRAKEATVALAGLLRQIKAAAQGVWETDRDLLSDAPTQFRFASPLASGADQIAAAAALEADFKLYAILPFARAEYAKDFAETGAKAAFRSLLGRAAAVWELPGRRSAADAAYAAAGHATIAQSDILIALWDGAPSRGAGGTADVVEAAVRRGTPVVHLQPTSGGPARVLWSGFDGLAPGLRGRDDAPSRPLTEAVVTELVQALCAAPQEAAERARLRAFYEEPERRLRSRPEYPMLLALTGVRGLRRSDFWVGGYAETTRADWRSYDAGRTLGGHDADGGMAKLESAFAWSDRLADHYGTAYRSGNILNFSFAALSVILALSGALIAHAKLYLATGELLLVCALVANTWIGTHHEWHRRWLDYRYLAEQLRPMRSLRLLGLSQPPSLPARSGTRQRHWTEWHASAIWREMDGPSGRCQASGVGPLSAHIADQEIRSQVDYHRHHAHRMHNLEHRLHLAGDVLFAATILGCLTLLLGYRISPDWVVAHAALFTLLAAGLPALGSALFGIRGQGDFAGSVRRSEDTADALEAIYEKLHPGKADLTTAALLVEDAARVMITDLGEWRLTYRERRLVIPA
jgi:hypothetical protein